MLSCICNVFVKYRKIGNSVIHVKSKCFKISYFCLLKLPDCFFLISFLFSLNFMYSF